MYTLSKMLSQVSSLHHSFHLFQAILPSANGLYCLTTYDFKECCMVFIHRTYHIIFISSLRDRYASEGSCMFLFICFTTAEPISRHTVSVLQTLLNN